MERRRIGSLDVSVVGLGCNNFGSRLDEAATARVVDAALDAGTDFFDTADIYGKTKSEEFLGRILGKRRDSMILATKFGMPIDDDHKGASAAYIRKAVEDSLRRLQTDRIDLYQLHRPDADTPLAETLGALDDLVKAGKVREIGCSNFSAQQLQEAEAAARPGGARFVSVQNEYSLLKREPERGVLDECARGGIGFIPYFPLASGLLTGKYRAGKPVPEGTRISAGWASGMLNDDNLAIVEKLTAYAEDHGHTLLELAFSWLLARPVVTSVIAGATSAEQAHSNAAAASWQMSAAQVEEVNALLPAV